VIPESLPLLCILYCPFHLFPCYSFLWDIYEAEKKYNLKDMKRRRTTGVIRRGKETEQGGGGR
jgi:hypothetical protein